MCIKSKRDHDAVHIDAVFLTAGRLFQRRVTSCEIRGGLSGAEARFSLYFFDFTPLLIIPPSLYSHLSLSPELCQAAHYHILVGFEVLTAVVMKSTASRI
jgi:hypothetical protein